MRKKVWLLTILITVPILASDNPSLSSPSSDNILLAVNHSCGRLEYFLQSPLPPVDREKIRDILSFLHNDGRIVITYPGGPKPEFNEKTRLRMLASDYLFESEKMGELSAEALEARFREIHSRLPEDWHVHDGPKIDHIKRIIAGSSFRTKAGPELVQLIEERILQHRGHRDGIVRLLSRQFGVLISNDITSDENCHVMDDLGPE